MAEVEDLTIKPDRSTLFEGASMPHTSWDLESANEARIVDADIVSDPTIEIDDLDFAINVYPRQTQAPDFLSDIRADETGDLQRRLEHQLRIESKAKEKLSALKTLRESTHFKNHDACHRTKIEHRTHGRLFGQAHILSESKVKGSRTATTMNRALPPKTRSSLAFPTRTETCSGSDVKFSKDS